MDNIKEFILSKIKSNEGSITILKEENIRLKEKLESSVNAGIEKWLGYEFESSSVATEEFQAFLKDFKKYIKLHIPENSEFIEVGGGHFYISGFIKRGSNYVYFSISDVRYFKDGWYNNVLIRTARDDKDFTGGSNGFTALKDFKKNVDCLFREG